MTDLLEGPQVVEGVVVLEDAVKISWYPVGILVDVDTLALVVSGNSDCSNLPAGPPQVALVDTGEVVGLPFHIPDLAGEQGSWDHHGAFLQEVESSCEEDKVVQMVVSVGFHAYVLAGDHGEVHVVVRMDVQEVEVLGDHKVQGHTWVHIRKVFQAQTEEVHKVSYLQVHSCKVAEVEVALPLVLGSTDHVDLVQTLTALAMSAAVEPFEIVPRSALEWQ